MAVTPSGIFSVPVDSLASMLSECSAFQQFVGAEDTAAAVAFIYPFVTLTPDESPFTRPFGLVYLSDNFSSSPYSHTNGELELVLERDIDEEFMPLDNSENYRDAMFTFSNFTGAIVAELLEKSRCGGSLMISEIRSESPMTSSFQKVQQEIPYMQQHFRISYGVK